MKLILKSDFRDYYDHMFDFEGSGEHRVLNRMSKTDMTKREQFRILELMEFDTPRHGLVKDLAKISGIEWVVVYFDELAHRGEGKGLFLADAALERHPDLYCSEFLETGFEGSVSERLLGIGHRIYNLTYSSDSWKSNCGNVQIEVSGQYPDRKDMLKTYGIEMNPLLECPLFAIDIIRPNIPHSSKSIGLAIDLNTSPGMKWTGMDEVLKPSEVVDLLKEYYQSFH